MRTQKELQATSLQFTFQGNYEIQTVIINQEPYFVARDVCNVLGISNSRDVMSRLDDDEKQKSVITTLGQNRKVNVVSESGLYALIFQSRKPNAKAFRKWVTSEVLPALRKTGKYEIPKAEAKQPKTSNFYLLSLEKAYNDFLEEEYCGYIGTELRLVKKIEAARTLFPDHKASLSSIS